MHKKITATIKISTEGFSSKTREDNTQGQNEGESCDDLYYIKNSNANENSSTALS